MPRCCSRLLAAPLKGARGPGGEGPSTLAACQPAAQCGAARLSTLTHPELGSRACGQVRICTSRRHVSGSSGVPGALAVRLVRGGAGGWAGACAGGGFCAPSLWSSPPEAELVGDELSGCGGKAMLHSERGPRMPAALCFQWSAWVVLAYKIIGRERGHSVAF